MSWWFRRKGSTYSVSIEHGVELSILVALALPVLLVWLLVRLMG